MWMIMDSCPKGLLKSKSDIKTDDHITEHRPPQHRLRQTKSRPRKNRHANHALATIITPPRKNADPGK